MSKSKMTRSLTLRRTMIQLWNSHRHSVTISGQVLERTDTTLVMMECHLTAQWTMCQLSARSPPERISACYSLSRTNLRATASQTSECLFVFSESHMLLEAWTLTKRSTMQWPESSRKKTHWGSKTHTHMSWPRTRRSRNSRKGNRRDSTSVSRWTLQMHTCKLNS